MFTEKYGSNCQSSEGHLILTVHTFVVKNLGRAPLLKVS